MIRNEFSREIKESMAHGHIEKKTHNNKKRKYQIVIPAKSVS